MHLLECNKLFPKWCNNKDREHNCWRCFRAVYHMSKSTKPKVSCFNLQVTHTHSTNTFVIVRWSSLQLHDYTIPLAQCFLCKWQKYLCSILLRTTTGERQRQHKILVKFMFISIFINLE